MHITFDEQPGYAVISLEGRMDAGNAGEFNKAFEAALQKAPKILLVDLGNLEYISSAGLRSVLTLAKAAKAASVALRFCCMRPMVADVFKVSGFSAMLSVFDDRQAALAGAG